MLTQGVLETLNRLIEGGELTSAVEQYMTYLRESEHSFYQLELEKNGLESAEALFKEFVQKNGFREFSGAIEPIAVGMRDIVRVLSKEENGEARPKARNVHLSVIKRDNIPPFFPVRFGPDFVSAIVIYGLPQYEGYDSFSHKEEALVFGQRGYLPLKALLFIESSMGYHELCLVFPTTRKSDVEGFALVSMELTGYIYFRGILPNVVTDGFIRASLGVIPLENVFRVCTIGSDPYDCLGFPGAQEYLLKHIPSLGPYLQALARRIESQS